MGKLSHLERNLCNLPQGTALDFVAVDPSSNNSLEGPLPGVEYDYTHGAGISRAAIVKIDLPSVGLSTYTFALEIPEADIAPILGRFLVIDALTLVSQGHLASPASLPLKVLFFFIEMEIPSAF